MTRPRRRLATALAAAAAFAPATTAGQVPAGGGEAPPLAVEIRAERVGFTLPSTVDVRVTRPAHVAVFEVRPGVGSVLRHPAVRDAGAPLAEGVHRLELEAGRGAFDRQLELSRLPARGRLTPLRPLDLGRPYLLVVAAEASLWLSGHRLGRVFHPRDARLSVPFLVDAVLRDVLPHPGRTSWAFDLRPGVPLAGPGLDARGLPPLGPARAGPPRRTALPSSP